MDVGTSGENGFPFTELPLGFGMALAMNEPAMRGYAGLTETEKEHLILRCKDARSKEEMEKIVNSLAPGGNLDNVLDGEEELGKETQGRDQTF